MHLAGKQILWEKQKSKFFYWMPMTFIQKCFTVIINKLSGQYFTGCVFWQNIFISYKYTDLTKVVIMYRL